MEDAAADGVKREGAWLPVSSQTPSTCFPAIVVLPPNADQRASTISVRTYT